MKKLNLYFVLLTIVLSINLISCSKDTEDDLSSSSNNAQVSLSLKANTITSYTATIKVTGAQDADVTVLGVKIEPKASSGGYTPSKTVEAGSHSKNATCNFTLDRGNTYYISAYANVNGNRILSDKKTVTVKK